MILVTWLEAFTSWWRCLSKIIVRILTLGSEEIDRDFFKNRIEKAVSYRKSLGFSDSFRAVFAESDLLPGLIVDKYGDYLSVQFLTLGMEVRKAMIVDILKEVLSPKGIYERSDVAVSIKQSLCAKDKFSIGSGISPPAGM